MTFLEEMQQQPQVLRRYVEQSRLNTDKQQTLIELIGKKAINLIIFTGMGSSLYASYIPVKYLRDRGIAAMAIESAELVMSGFTLLTENTLVVAVSQSGESTEVLEPDGSIPFKENLIAISNYSGSRLVQTVSLSFGIYAGIEYLTSTKTFTNTVAALLHLAFCIANESAGNIRLLEEQFLDCAEKMEALLADQKAGNKIADFISDARFLLCVGSGYSYASASHSEIVAEEAGKFFSSRFTPGQFIHGPIELIGKGFGAIVFDFDVNCHARVDVVIGHIRQYGGKVLLVTNRQIGDVDKNLYVYFINHKNAMTSPLIEIIPVEMGINQLCLSRGQIPGKLERVAKRIADS